MDEATSQFIKASVAQQDRIIREIAEQGYKYLIMKRDFDFKDMTAICNYKYRGVNSLDGVDTDDTDGVEVFDLSRVHEYLERMKNIMHIKTNNDK